MSVSISSWAQTLATCILITCCILVVFITQASSSDYMYLFWHNVAPILAFQFTITALCFMNGMKNIPGLALLISLGFAGEILWRIYS